MKQENGFTIPAVEQLCATIRQLVSQVGGKPSEFFAHLTPSVSDAFVDMNFPLRKILEMCLDDPVYRDRVLKSLTDTADREYLANFLEGWDIWRILEPSYDHWLRLVIAGAPIKELLASATHRMNEVFRCTSTIYLDSRSEDLRVRSAVQLAYPDKEVGGAGTLILSMGVDDYIELVRLMLQSLILDDGEKKLFKFPKDNEIVPGIMRELNELIQVIDEFRAQIDQMLT